MKGTKHYELAALVLLFALSLVRVAEARDDPVSVLAGMIQQLQTGTPNSSWYGPQLWQTIAMQTNNSGIYPQLVQLGSVTNIEITNEVQLPEGWLYAMTAQHANGQSTWQMGLNEQIGKIVYANFRTGASPTSFPLPAAPKQDPQPTPGPNPRPTPQPVSDACVKFPNLC